MRPSYYLPATRLSGRALVVARSLWAMLTALALVLFVLSIPVHWRQLVTVTTDPVVWLQLAPVQANALANVGLSLRAYAIYMLTLQIVVVIGFAGLCLLIFWRRSDDAMAMFVSLVAILFGVTDVPVSQALAQTTSVWRALVDLLNSVGWGSGLLLFYLFPDGHFVPRWTRWLAASMMVWVLTWPFLPALNPDHWAFPLPFIAKLSWYSTGILAQVYRYARRSTPVARQQTKWAVFGFAAAFAGFLVFNLPVVFFVSLQDTTPFRMWYLVAAYPVLALLPMLLAPLSLGFACLRYRLWDIDLIINRAMIYGILTASLAVVYVGSVIVLQWLFLRITGQGQSEVVTAIATLVIATAFQPVRRRAQMFIDRRFYRRKYEAERALVEFSAKLREDTEADLNQLTSDLLALVDETMQPAHASLWISETIRARRDG